MDVAEWDGTVPLQGYRYSKEWLERIWLDFLTGGIPWTWEVTLTYGHEPGGAEGLREFSLHRDRPHSPNPPHAAR